MAHIGYNTLVNKSNELMKPYKVNFPPSLWLSGRRKAGLRSFASIVRELVGMWLDGSVVDVSIAAPLVAKYFGVKLDKVMIGYSWKDDEVKI